MLSRFSSKFLFAFIFALTLASSAPAQNDKKIYYALFVDNSGSMRTQFEQVLDLSSEILDRIPNGSIGAPYHFKTDEKKKDSALITEGLGWTEERLLLKQYLGSLLIVSGQTTLLDAVDHMADKLNARGNNDGASEKIIFLITDGEERNSKTRKEPVLQKLRDSNIKVYIVGLLKELDSEGGYTRMSAREKAVTLLERIAKESGGRTVLSKSSKTDVIKLVNELFAK